jgi:DNA-binding IclR family transcriptional regulator
LLLLEIYDDYISYVKENISKYEINSTFSISSEKAFIVLEWFSNNQHKQANLKEIAEQTKIPMASLLRLLKTMIIRGYISRTKEKKYSSLFSITRSEKSCNSILAIIEIVMKQLLEKCEQSVELLTVNKSNLYWLKKFEVPDLPLIIHAHEGFSRTLYELDAPSRLYLNYLGIEDVEKEFIISKFYCQESTKTIQDWTTAEKMIADANYKQVVFDHAGNGSLIRRYAAMIMDQTDNFSYILTIAEPALEHTSNDTHFKKQVSLLENAQTEIQRRLS